MKEGSKASDVMAFHIVAGFCPVWLTVVGLIGTLGLFGADTSHLSSTSAYDYSYFVQTHLAIPMLVYQFWNFVFTLINRDLYSFTMICHHIISGCLAYFSLAPYLHYYAPFYLGVVEMSGFPLSIVDVFKFFPELKSQFAALYTLALYSFAVSFILLRLVIWPYISLSFWSLSIELLDGGKSHSRLVVIIFLVANILMTGLQFFWGYKIIRRLINATLGAGRKKCQQ